MVYYQYSDNVLIMMLQKWPSATQNCVVFVCNYTEVSQNDHLANTETISLTRSIEHLTTCHLEIQKWKNFLGRGKPPNGALIHAPSVLVLNC